MGTSWRRSDSEMVLHVDTKGAKVGGEFLQSVVAAGDEDEPRSQRGELAGKFGT